MAVVKRYAIQACLMCAAAVSVLGLVACGGDDSAADAGSEPAPAAANKPAPAPAGESAAPASAGPEAVLRRYYELLDARDIEGVMALFAEDAVLGNHPFGKRIRDIQNWELDSKYEISNVKVTGSTMTWDHVWRQESRSGSKLAGPCNGTGHKAIVEDGKIVSWTYASIKCPGPPAAADAAAEITFELDEVNGSGQTGTATFVQSADGLSAAVEVSPTAGLQHANITRGACERLGDLYAIIQVNQPDGTFGASLGAPLGHSEPFSLAGLESGKFVVLIVDIATVGAEEAASLTVLEVEFPGMNGSYQVAACGRIPAATSDPAPAPDPVPDEEPAPAGDEATAVAPRDAITIELDEVNGSGQSGTATLAQSADGFSATVEVSPPAGVQHANITRGTCEELGDLYTIIQTSQSDGRFEAGLTGPLTFEGNEPVSLADVGVGGLRGTGS